MLSISNRTNDRRAHHRYSVRAEVRYRYVGAAPEAPWKSGYTVDISAGGLCLDIPHRLPVGTRLELAIEWTGLYHGRDKMWLVAVATVTRGRRAGIGLRMIRHCFRGVQPAAHLPQRETVRLRA